MGMFDQQKQKPEQGQQQSRGMDYDQSDPFSRVGGSTPNEGGVYPLPGVYPLLYLDLMKMIRSRKGEDIFIAEFDIVASEVDARPKGTRMSWVVNFRFDASPGNVKAFLAALMGVQTDEVDAESTKYACSPKNPAHGRLVRLEASATKTKGGNDFTLCKWQSVSDQYQEKADKLREEAGFPPF